jgi:Ca2+-binding EF-hand superfamily protein
VSSSSSCKKPNLTAFAIAKVDLLTFLHVTVKELPGLQLKLKEDLVFLFEFLDPKKTGFVTVKDLRHILTETMNGNDLSNNMFINVLDAGGITMESIRQERVLTVNYNALIDNFLMCNRWQTMLL